MKKNNPNFFNIELNKFTEKELELKLEDILDNLGQHLIATPNPEMLLAAKKHPDIKDTLNKMHLRIPDGIGLSIMSILTGQGKLNRFAGVDVFLDLVKIANKKGQKILLLGGWDNKAEKVLKATMPNLNIHQISGMIIELNGNKWQQPERLLEEIRKYQPNIIGVALGSGNHNKQERWIVDHAIQFPSVNIAMGIGGTLDFIGGEKQRAPQWMQKIGLEWLWRLIKEPARYKRILNAVIHFPISVILDRIQKDDK